VGNVGEWSDSIVVLRRLEEKPDVLQYYPAFVEIGQSCGPRHYRAFFRGVEISVYLTEWITATLALTMSGLLAEFWIFVRALMMVWKFCIRIETLRPLVLTRFRVLGVEQAGWARPGRQEGHL